tara:strand:+ start:2461 stop:3522 length:1062 start_codon:yes stop_codon:yes gene_type:complete
MNYSQSKDDLDLLRVLETLWRGKWIILLCSTLCSIIVSGFLIFGPEQNSVAVTEIKPISAEEAEQYTLFNAQGVLLILRDENEKFFAPPFNPSFGQTTKANKNRGGGLPPVPDFSKTPEANLIKLFLEQWSNRTLLEKAFKKHRLLEEQDYENAREYEIAIARLAGRVSIVPPTLSSTTRWKQMYPNWTVRFEFNNQEKWLKILEEVGVRANENVREIIQIRVKNILNSVLEQNLHHIGVFDSQINSLQKMLEQEEQNYGPSITDQASQELFSTIRKKQFIKMDTRVEQALEIFSKTPVVNQSVFKSVLFTSESTVFKKKRNNIRTILLSVLFGAGIGVLYVSIVGVIRGNKV